MAGGSVAVEGESSGVSQGSGGERGLIEGGSWLSENAGFWAGEGGGVGSGEVRGEALNNPMPTPPLSKQPNISSHSMLDATADSKSNDLSGTQTGRSQALPARPACANFVSQPMAP
jgi:hypothetical protein